MESSISDILKRHVAQKLLREEMFYDQPTTYAATDLLEDIPQIALYGRLGQDVLPSAAIINSDAEKRKKQLDEAEVRAKGYGQDLNGYLTGIGKNTANTFAGSLPVVAGFTALEEGKNSAMAHWKNKPLPHSFNERFGKNFKSNVGKSLAASMVAGAMFPSMGYFFKPEDKQYEEAKQILQKNPVMSSLPGMAGVASGMYGNEDENTAVKSLKGGAMGAGVLGGLTVGSHMMDDASEPIGHIADHAKDRVLQLLGKIKSDKVKPLMPIPNPYSNMSRYKTPGLVGAGIGAGLGALYANYS